MLENFKGLVWQKKTIKKNNNTPPLKTNILNVGAFLPENC